MKVKARLEIDFPSAEEARRMLESLRADDDGYLVQRVEGTTLVAEAEGESPGSVRETLEDYLACLSGATATTASVRNGADGE